MDARLKKTVDRFINKTEPTKIKTPVFIFDLEILKDNYQKIKKAIAGGDNIIKYSIKANHEEKVIQALKQLGCGFEIASLGELELLKKYNIRPELIYFSAPVKLPQHIIEAFKYGVRYYTYDSYEELEKLSKYAPGSKVYLRLDVSNHGARWKLNHKFGAGEEDWLPLLTEAKKIGLDPYGVTYLVGWNNTHHGIWKKATIKAQRLIEASYKAGINLRSLNLGGGFPAHNVDQFYYLQIITKTINPILAKLKKQFKINIVAEPGTFLVANCAVLLAKVYANLKRNNSRWIFVDATIVGGFYWILEGLKYEIYLTGPKNKKDFDTNYIVTGPTCDSYDTFSRSVKLPESVSVGDILAISPAGAYISSAKEYNGFSYPETKFI